MSQTKVQLKNVRLSFAKLFKAEAFKPGDAPKYSANFLIDPSTPQGKENLAAVKAGMDAACEAKWGKGKVPRLKQDHRALKQEGEMDYDGYDGMLVVVAKDTRPPVLLDRDKSALNEQVCIAENKLYSGCYVDVLVNFWAYNHPDSKGCSANLRAVRFREHGDTFSSVAPVDTDEFDDLEGEAVTSNDDFDL